MRDIDVRNALRRKILKRHYKDDGTLVIDEFGLSHGATRIDVAVANGRLHGFEIKSDADTLDRLPAQAEIYNKVFDYVTIVCGEKHEAEVRRLVPHWWGIKIAYSGKRGAVHFRQTRYPRLNRRINPIEVARLLWRDEAMMLLSEVAGLTRGIKSKSREALYQKLADLFPVRELADLVRETLKAREGWRSDALRLKYAG
jgi:hypothetical protein